ncbi:hypothetical protein A3I58_04025 [Candidatus Peregrinibacteria bacterium RIFCSPLOWO2_02_FULL_39_10]|nr:MAG: hypothetical protein A3I58_04025 [Candidatus Peregrinibacteria bacterium RIFCSPLOWO2_02_FULL_39_10]
MAEDCAPIRDVLELEGSQGAFRSRFVPDAVFRSLRVADIARFLKRGIFQLGIIGDDTACEEDLEIQGFSSKILAQLDRVRSKTEATTELEPYIFCPVNRKAILNLGEPTCMTLFARPDVKGTLPFPNRLLSSGRIATSYPNLAGKALRISNDMNPVSVETFDGKIESIVANGDDKNIVGGFDLVRTGNTLDEFGLVKYGSVAESRPGIWQTPSLITDQSMRSGVADVLAILRERLGYFINC